VAWSEREDRIQVDFSNLWHIFGKSRHPQEQLTNRPHVCRWVSTVTFKKTEALDPANHLGRVKVGQRSYAETNVRENLDVYTAKPEGQKRAEKWVVRHTCHHLNPTTKHCLYDHTVHRVGLVLLLNSRADFLECHANGFRVGQSETDAPNFALVHKSP